METHLEVLHNHSVLYYECHQCHPLSHVWIIISKGAAEAVRADLIFYIFLFCYHDSSYHCSQRNIYLKILLNQISAITLLRSVHINTNNFTYIVLKISPKVDFRVHITTIKTTSVANNGWERLLWKQRRSAVTAVVHEPWPQHRRAWPVGYPGRDDYPSLR